MNFVQTISFTSTRMDEMQKLMDEFGEQSMASQAGDGGFVRNQVLKDRDKENAYVVVAEFVSYEKAMENSNKPETGEFAGRMMALADGPPTFYNLDVLDERM